MFKAFTLVIIGIALALWGHSKSHDDQFFLGLKKAGQLELRSAGGSVSLSASEALLKLGERVEVDWRFGELKPPLGAHSGMRFHFAKPMDWEIRLPYFAIALLAGVLAFTRLAVGRLGT